ncbi:MAG: hypothetical protein KJN67_02745 [Pontiella sp.]|nr:hypothetical protein [Pontiella sp.]MBT8046064.1 hypothetical protein [Pontiella sp.]NNJ70769.1 hypothetical protein [Kiritimatiellales bacterium]
MSRMFCTLLVLAGVTLSANAQYAAKITVGSGNSFVVNRLNIRDNRLYSNDGQSSSSLAMVKQIEFRFTGLGLAMCEKMFRSGDLKSLESLLNQYVAPVARHSALPTNLGDYLLWMVRVQYWNENQPGMSKSIGHLRQTNNQALIDAASLYFVMLLIDQGKLADAKTVFASVAEPDKVSVPMAEYIRGRMAYEERDSRAAMQHVARIIAFHSRDPEWMPPATALEALVYQQLGQPQKAAVVADEMIIAYPGTRWSTLGEKIKMESMGNTGG